MNEDSYAALLGIGIPACVLLSGSVVLFFSVYYHRSMDRGNNAMRRAPANANELLGLPLFRIGPRIHYRDRKTNP